MTSPSWPHPEESERSTPSLSLPSVEPPSGSSTLGVVVVHEPGGVVADLPAVRDLVDQVDELLLVFNGPIKEEAALAFDDRVRCIGFDTNRGTAAAWNAGLSAAAARGHRYLYLLDQDSRPFPDAVARAVVHLNASRASAIVQPAVPDRLGLDPFPWNTVASGSLYEAAALQEVGAFDERLFVDEVDHELLARLMGAGRTVEQLATPSIAHATGTPREITLVGHRAVVSGHTPARRRLQGYSAGLLIRRHLRDAPLTSARLLARQSLTAVKDLAAGERPSVRSLVTGILDGFAASKPPRSAAFRPCPYCDGVLLGRFGVVPDWLFGTGPPGEVYRCSTCGALAAGRVPGEDEIASWYESYYTHNVEPERSRRWSAFWPTPRRRREADELRRYLSAPGSTGRFLEVGAGSGQRLIEFAAAGWEVVGQDLDPMAGRLARAEGISIHRCTVDELVGREQPFDLIGLSHVLEHAPDPRAMLQACAALLAQGGQICVISPNAESFGRRLFGRWWFGLDQPRHLAIPTIESMMRVTAPLDLQLACSKSVATNGAVILGGSLDRAIRNRLPPGNLRRASRSLTALLGQSMGRVAIRLHSGLGEEVVWVGHRPSA